MQNSISPIKKYFYAYLYIAQVTFFWYDRKILFTALFLIALLAFYFYKKNYGRTIVFFTLTITVILVLQIALFERFRFTSVFRLYMGILFPYLLLKIIGFNYMKYLVNILYVIVIISFVFYIPSLLSDKIHSLIGTISPALGTDIYLRDQNFIIYTWEQSSDFFLRNSGNFTEPGYFASILNLILAFNILHENKFFTKKNIVFILGIISTFSTGGYITLFFIITSYLLMISKNKYKYLLIPIMLYLSYFTYKQLDFLESKITLHYETQVKGGLEKGRFGSTISDLKELINYPITGRGLIKSTRFDEVEYWEGDAAPRQGLNGITGAMLTFGVFGFTYYLFLMISSLKKYIKFHNFKPVSIYMLLGCVLISASSQPILLTPIYFSLIFFNDFNIINKQNNVKALNYNT